MNHRSGRQLGINRRGVSIALAAIAALVVLMARLIVVGRNLAE